MRKAFPQSPGEKLSQSAGDGSHPDVSIPQRASGSAEDIGDKSPLLQLNPFLIAPEEAAAAQITWPKCRLSE